MNHSSPQVTTQMRDADGLYWLDSAIPIVSVPRLRLSTTSAEFYPLKGAGGPSHMIESPPPTVSSPAEPVSRCGKQRSSRRFILATIGAIPKNAPVVADPSVLPPRTVTPLITMMYKRAGRLYSRGCKVKPGAVLVRPALSAEVRARGRQFNSARLHC
jgi:hypothetical protein